MEVRRKEYIAEFRFSEDEDTDFITVKHACHANSLVIKYLYEPWRSEPYRFSAYATGMYQINGRWMVGNRPFTNKSKRTPSWIVDMVLKQTPEWFCHATT
jgi:hypothetical protein